MRTIHFAHVGPAAGLYLVLGIVTGSIGVTYLLFTIINCAVAVAGLQYTFVRIKSGQPDMIETQIMQVRHCL